MRDSFTFHGDLGMKNTKVSGIDKIKAAFVKNKNMPVSRTIMYSTSAMFKKQLALKSQCYNLTETAEKFGVNYFRFRDYVIMGILPKGSQLFGNRLYYTEKDLPVIKKKLELRSKCYNLTETAEKLGVDYFQFRNYVITGILPKGSMLFGTKFYYTEKDLNAIRNMIKIEKAKAVKKTKVKV